MGDDSDRDFYNETSYFYAYMVEIMDLYESCVSCTDWISAHSGAPSLPSDVVVITRSNDGDDDFIDVDIF
jgi:hypothetical protein